MVLKHKCDWEEHLAHSSQSDTHSCNFHNISVSLVFSYFVTVPKHDS